MTLILATIVKQPLHITLHWFGNHGPSTVTGPLSDTVRRNTSASTRRKFDGNHTTLLLISSFHLSQILILSRKYNHSTNAFMAQWSEWEAVCSAGRRAAFGLPVTLATKPMNLIGTLQSFKGHGLLDHIESRLLKT